ncbi:Protein ASPARTIC PROTEASE IN GUARD CELL 1 [Capsicum chinense]|nr:Protein ASPARTIC PROTEASE IN GUARD CELL 1 [Capsicum chinense]
MATSTSSIFFFVLLFTSVLSRTSLYSPSRTTNLDVSFSIMNALNALIPVDSSLKSEENKVSSSSSSLSLSLHLHSRRAVGGNLHESYSSLMLARLERDSARAKSLQKRVDLTVHDIRRADLKPVETEFFQADQEIDGPIISGTSQGSGEYFSRIGIGHPVKQVYVVLDTGSDVSWIQCAPCADCYQQADPIFDPNLSKTYSSLSCETSQCKSLDVSQCRNDTCLYEVSYGDGSYTVGDFCTESITFSGASSSVENVAIGCGHNNEGLFVGAAGLLGLGGGSLSFPSQIKTSHFSYCLVDRDSDSTSTLEFGGATPPNAVTASIIRNSKLDTFYYLDLTGLSVAGNLLPVSQEAFKVSDNGDGGVIIDSGTAVTRLQTSVYNTLRDEFVKGTRHLKSTNGVALFDTCYDLKAMKSVEVPTVSLHFSNGKELPLPAKNYLIPVDSNGTFCFAFAPTSSSLSIIGNVQQQGTRVSFDLKNSLIGFSSNQC